MADELIESNTYSARDDFPVFGQRLLALQRYNRRHQPSKITDLWRNRQNPLQWYTFWAVLVVGGSGLLLAILQLIIGVLQLVYTIRPVK
jgi:sterol desaturase/sphingolipid hydroxylase (fatty acid hydroxylase superfamily)